MELSQFSDDHVVHVPGYGDAKIGDIRRTEARLRAIEAELALELNGYISLLPDASQRKTTGSGSSFGPAPSAG